MKKPTIRELRQKIKALNWERIKDRENCDSILKEMILTTATKNLICLDLLERVYNSAERNVLFEIAQTIAETDSIGEMYNYCEKYDMDTFKCFAECLEHYNGKKDWDIILHTKFEDVSWDWYNEHWNWYELKYIEPALEIYETVMKEKLS